MNTLFANKADVSSVLVQMEKELEEYRNQKKTEIIASYTDLVDWLMMLHRMPHIEIADENIKQIQLAYQQTNRIMSAIESQEVSLKSQRDDIERRLQIETKAFQEELNDVKQSVEKFKENNNRKREDEYNNQIKKINMTLQGLSERLKKINAQEMDLELTATECPAIEDC